MRRRTADPRVRRSGQGARPDRLRAGGSRRRHDRGRPHTADDVDPLGGQPRRARGLRADHLRLQRLAGRVRGRPRVVPAGRLQRRDRRGRGIRRSALPSRPRRPDHAQLGVGRLPAAARAADRAHRLAAADRGRRVGRRDLLGRVLGCRARRSSRGSRCSRQRHPHPDGRRAVDARRVRRGSGDAEGRRLRDADRHRRRGHRRVVAVRVLAVPAELRRRPHRPLDHAHRRRRAQRTRGGRVGRVVRRPLRRRLRRQQRAPSATRSSSTTRSRSATPASGTPSPRSTRSATTCSSCPRRTSATARRSAAARGSGASRRSATTPTALASTSSSASRTSTSPSSPTSRS